MKKVNFLGFIGIFSIDPSGATKSIEGTIHQIIVFLSFLSEVGAFFSLSYAFKNTLPWNSFKATTILIVIISIISLLWFWVNIYVIIGGFPGLAERIVFFVFFLWEILVAMRLLTHNGITAKTSKCCGMSIRRKHPHLFLDGKINN